MDQQKSIIKITQKQIKCNVNKHDKQNLSYLCLSKDCAEPESFLCQICTITNHQSHVNQLINLQQLEEEKEEDIVNWPLEQDKKKIKKVYDQVQKYMVQLDNVSQENKLLGDLQKQISQDKDQIIQIFQNSMQNAQKILQGLEDNMKKIIEEMEQRYQILRKKIQFNQKSMQEFPKKLIEQYNNAFNLQRVKDIVQKFTLSQIDLLTASKEIKLFSGLQQRQDKILELNTFYEQEKKNQDIRDKDTRESLKNFEEFSKLNILNYMNDMDQLMKRWQNDTKIESKILQGDDLQLLSNWFKYQRNFTLLYRGTEDGFTGGVFHQKCDKKGSTLTLVKTTTNYRFGAYTDCIWRSRNSYYGEGQNNFVFSLNNKKIYYYNDMDNQQAIYDYGPYPPRFGGGHDICISNNSNINQESFSELNYSYGKAEYRDKTTMAGTRHFTTLEIEVYLVTN